MKESISDRDQDSSQVYETESKTSQDFFEATQGYDMEDKTSQKS